MTFGRLEKIKEILRSDGVVYLKDIMKIFPEYSSMTIRRDFERLENDGIAVKIRGGIRMVSEKNDEKEPVYSLRASKNMDAKMRIAKRALPYVDSGRSVFLDAGSTIMCLAEALPDIQLTVVTSGPNIALEMLKKRYSTVNLVGGLINRDNLCISGKQALDFVRDINIDIAFMSPSGFSVKDGFTCGNYAEAEIKRAVIRKANRIVMLMDSYKVEKSLIYTFAAPRDVDALITDAALPAPFEAALRKAGAELIIA